MEFEMQFQGSDANEEVVSEIEDWLRNEKIHGLVIRHESRPTKPEEMSLAIATIIAGPVADVAKSIFNYMGMRRPKLKVKLKINDDIVEIDAENLKDQDTVLNRLISIVEAKGS